VIYFSPTQRGEYVIILLRESYRLLADKMHIPLTVPIDEFRITDLLILDQVRVFHRANDGSASSPEVKTSDGLDKNGLPAVK